MFGAARGLARKGSDHLHQQSLLQVFLFAHYTAYFLALLDSVSLGNSLANRASHPEFVLSINILNMAASNSAEGEMRPLINSNPELQTYYQSLESRIGYRFVLGGTRHFGYW